MSACAEAISATRRLKSVEFAVYFIVLYNYGAGGHDVLAGLRVAALHRLRLLQLHKGPLFDAVVQKLVVEAPDLFKGGSRRDVQQRVDRALALHDVCAVAQDVGEARVSTVAFGGEASLVRSSFFGFATLWVLKI